MPAGAMTRLYEGRFTWGFGCTSSADREKSRTGDVLRRRAASFSLLFHPDSKTSRDFALYTADQFEGIDKKQNADAKTNEEAEATDSQHHGLKPSLNVARLHREGEKNVDRCGRREWRRGTKAIL